MMKLHSALSVVGSITTPVAPAASIGWEAYSWMLHESSQHYIALAAGIGSAVGLEVVAALAGYVTIERYREGDRRWLLAASIMALYVCAGLMHLGLSIGGIMFVIAAAFWVLVALMRDAKSTVEAASIERQDDKRHEREMEAEKLRMEHEAKLAKIQAGTEKHRASLELSQASTPSVEASIKPASNTHECNCGRTFGSAQALGAHKRFCKGGD